jgi:serine/threonine protein kinase
LGNKERNLILKRYTIFCIVLLGGLFLTLISILLHAAGESAQIGIGIFVPGCCITGIGFLGICGIRIADYISLRTKRIREARSGDEYEKQFRIIRQIGQGANAQRYEGECRKPGVWQAKHVAIKKLPEMFTDLTEVTDEFTKEAKFLKTYRHPNLVEFVKFFAAPHWCLILKYYYRGSLDKVLTDKQYLLPWNPERNGFMCGIAEGLRFLHENSIIHRDMKPGNVLIDEDMTPKITDLGTARIQDTLSMTKAIGTPAYIAPELMTTGKNVQYDKSADVYSFGMILWAIWQKKEPFLEFKQAWQIINYTAGNGRPSLAGCPSSKLSDLISRCWNSRPDERPRMSEVCDELNTVTSELSYGEFTS